jgi:hypothetical protein
MCQPDVYIHPCPAVDDGASDAHSATYGDGTACNGGTDVDSTAIADACTDTDASTNAYGFADIHSFTDADRCAANADGPRQQPTR